MRSNQQGFTLIELMIALALGLIIVASGLFLFFSAQKSLALQKASSEIQDNANFALNYIAKDIRLSNLGSATASITPTLALGGIIFNQTNLPLVNTNYVTAANTGASNIENMQSDQLTIMYKPQAQGFDCEGDAITQNDVSNRYVVERYFIREDTNLVNGETSATALSLACHAGRTTGTTTPTNFGTSDTNKQGQIIVKRADSFKVNLIVASSDTLRDMSLNDYIAAQQKPRILAVQLGIITHAVQPISQARSNTISILNNQNLTLKNTNSVHHLYETVVQTIALRNGLGER